MHGKAIRCDWHRKSDHGFCRPHQQAAQNRRLCLHPRLLLAERRKRLLGHRGAGPAGGAVRYGGHHGLGCVRQLLQGGYAAARCGYFPHPAGARLHHLLHLSCRGRNAGPQHSGQAGRRGQAVRRGDRRGLYRQGKGHSFWPALYARQRCRHPLCAQAQYSRLAGRRRPRTERRGSGGKGGYPHYVGIILRRAVPECELRRKLRFAAGQRPAGGDRHLGQKRLRRRRRKRHVPAGIVCRLRL